MRSEPRLGRNSPCPCGSGRKFKHCHGRSAATPASADSRAAKASERLLELAGPIVDDPDLDPDEFRARLLLTMMAWNMAVLEATACDSSDTSDTAELRAKIRELGIEPQIDALAQRKVRLFPDDMRHLIDLVVTTGPTGGRYVQVISAT